MSMFFTRDAYDEDREARIAQIGLEAYEKEQKEAREKCDRENPNYVSATEPHVQRHDIIGHVVKQPNGTILLKPEFFVTRIDKNGDIFGTIFTQHPMKDDPKYLGREHQWEYGDYRKLSSIAGEY